MNNLNVIIGSIQTKTEGYFTKQLTCTVHKRQGKAEGLTAPGLSRPRTCYNETRV